MKNIPDKCLKCGAPIKWDKTSNHIDCEYCGYTNLINNKNSSKLKKLNNFLSKGNIYLEETTKKIGNFLKGINPFVALGIFAVGWLFMRSMRNPEVPDFGTNDFEETERGILVNKQSNNACIPVVYGERKVGGTRVFVETSGTDNTYLYVALVLCEGEINSIEEIRVDDKVVTS